MQHYPVYAKSQWWRARHEEFFAQLSNGQLSPVIETVSATPKLLTDLIQVLQHPDLEIHVRLGVSAVLESLAGQPAMTNIIAPLQILLLHPQVHLRCDACYFLSLTESPLAQAALRSALGDSEPQVQQAAQEALEYLDEMTLAKD